MAECAEHLSCLYLDQSTEFILLINYSINEVSNLPCNVCDILNGRYEDVLNNALSKHITEALKCGEDVEEIMTKDISELNKNPSWLCAGIASLLYFVQCNWTGPPVDNDIDWLKTRREEAIKSLSLHNECNVNVRKPELLYLSKKIFSNKDLQLIYKTSNWWLLRAHLLHQLILDENSGVLFDEMETIIQNIDHNIIHKNSLLCAVLLKLECARFYLRYRLTSSSEPCFQSARGWADITLHLLGAMGKRMKYQQEEKAQLYLKVKVNKEIFPSVDCEDTPKSLNLNDESRLEQIKFAEQVDTHKVELGAIEEAIIFIKYFQLQLCQPRDNLTDEEIRPYLNKVIESTKNWSLKMTSLYCRCLLESTHWRTVERSMLQAESLLKDFNDAKAPAARRMDLFFASGMEPIWRLEEKWATMMFKGGLVKDALEVFKKLGLWEDVILCYNTLDLKHKAAEIIQQELSKKPTVKLWCLLGDATGDVAHYETAWKLSKEKSSTVQKHWGFYYFQKKNYAEAVPHLKLSVQLNNIQELVWFRLGYAELQLEDWKSAAAAYRRYCALDNTSFEAWNNLAKAYIKLGEKRRAWETLQDAIKCDYDRWEVWDNLMVVSIDLKHFSEVIRCYNRILDLKNNHLDVQVLEILVEAITNDIYDANGKPASCLLESSLELFGRISSNTANTSCSDMWTIYAELVKLKKTEVHLEKAAYYLQQAYRAAISDQRWFENQNKTLNVLMICITLAEKHLCNITDASVAKKRKVLGSVKLPLQAVVKKVKEQQWSDKELFAEELRKVEEYLKIVTDKLEEIK